MWHHIQISRINYQKINGCKFYSFSLVATSFTSEILVNLSNVILAFTGV